MPKRPQFIPPEAYPQPVNRKEAANAARLLRSPAAAKRGGRALEMQRESLSAAVHGLADDLEKAGGAQALVLQAAHEIRGLGESAGLAAAGRIADGLCRYIDEMQRASLRPDQNIIELHVNAILRATRNEQERGAISEAVAKELAALVSHKLTEIKN